MLIVKSVDVIDPLFKLLVYRLLTDVQSTQIYAQASVYLFYYLKYIIFTYFLYLFKVYA